MRDMVYDVVENGLRVQFENLPPAVVDTTKKFILDTFATAIGGSRASGCQEVVDYVKDCGGKKESTVWTYGGKVIAENAALANGMMAHALDFDDTHDKAGLHANVSVLPAAFAMAERTGGTTGKEFLTAVALGNDLVCRLGLSAYERIWIFSAVCGYFGATLAAGKILGLDENQLLHAMGIVYSQCAGQAQCIVDRGLVKRMQPAFAAKAGTLSCILAQKGITGARNTFEGQDGFFPLYFGGNYDRNKVLDGLGKVFEGGNLSIKLYPSCRATHPVIDGTLELVREHDLRPEEVAEVTVHVNKGVYKLVGKPFEITESPQVDAQFSIPYTTAVAILNRQISISDFVPERLKSNRAAYELAQRVHVVVDQPYKPRTRTPCIVEIKTKDNRVYEKRVDVVSGGPDKPASMEDLTRKFRDCANFSARPLPEGSIERLIGLISKLEEVPNITDLVSLLVET